MDLYVRTKLIITEFDSEDVITTSGEPTQKIYSISPNYSNAENAPNTYTINSNWTLWK